MATEPAAVESASSKALQNTVSRASRDLLAEGLLGVFKPAVQQVDSCVQSLRESQLELRQQLETVALELSKCPTQGEPDSRTEMYIKKINNIRRKVTIINNVLQNAQERLNKLNKQVPKDVDEQKPKQPAAAPATASGASS